MISHTNDSDGDEMPEDSLAAVLIKHLPNMNAEHAARVASDVFRRQSVARAFSRSDAANRRPSKDDESLQSASKALKRAADHLSKLGLAGSSALVEALSTSQSPHRSVDLPASRSSLSEIQRLVGELKVLGEVLDSARDEVGVEEGGYNDHRRENLEAHATASLCVELYEAQTGEPATRRYRTGTKHRYGPFSEFVGDVFNVTGLTADPDHFIRQAQSGREA